MEVPDAAADLDQKLDGVQMIDLGSGRHQGIAAMRALDMDVDAMGHDGLPYSDGHAWSAPG